MMRLAREGSRTGRERLGDNRVIPIISTPNFYLLLHSCFNAYVRQRELGEGQHVVSWCSRWTYERERLYEVIEGIRNVDELMEKNAREWRQMG